MNKMVCYICGKSASFRCSVCGRYVCNEHTHHTGDLKYFLWWNKFEYNNLPSYLCDDCFKKAKKYSDLKEHFKYYFSHYCDFHKTYHDDKYLSSDKWHPTGSESKKYPSGTSGRGSNILGIVYCGNCNNQLCSNSTIIGEKKETIVGANLEWGNEYLQKLIYYTEYLCPICRSIVFYDVDIYKNKARPGFFSRSRFVYDISNVGICYMFDERKLDFCLKNTHDQSESFLKRYCWSGDQSFEQFIKRFEEEIADHFRY